MFILGAAYAPVEAEIQIILGIRVPFLGSLPGQREAFFLIQFNAVRTKVSEAQVRHGLHVSGRNRIFQKLQALPTVLRDAVAIKKALAQIPLRVRKTVFRRFLQPVKGLSFVFFCPPAIETATVVLPPIADILSVPSISFNTESMSDISSAAIPISSEEITSSTSLIT